MEFRTEKERVVCVVNGQEMGEIDFPEAEPGLFCICHTEVSPELQGQGIAAKLVEQAVDAIHARGGKVTATCSYAAHWLTKHPEFAD